MNLIQYIDGQKHWNQCCLHLAKWS